MWPFKPVWMSADWKKAFRTVSQLTDQKELKNVALNAEDVRVRKLAIERLSDQKKLADIAKENKGCWIDGNSNVRKAAIEKLTDLTILNRIANSPDSEYYVCKWMVGDGGLALRIKTVDLRDVAHNRVLELRKKLLSDVMNLTNQALLADIAQNAIYSDVCLAAADRLDDKALAQEVYAGIANSADQDMSKKATERLTAPKALANVAKNSKHGEVRLMAADKLKDKALAEEVYAEVAKNGEEWDVRKAALERLTAQEKLEEIVRNAAHNDIRLMAADRLGDKALVEEVYADMAKQRK